MFYNKREPVSFFYNRPLYTLYTEAKVDVTQDAPIKSSLLLTSRTMLSVLVLKSSLITAPTSHSHLPRSLSSTPTISRPQWPPPPPPPTFETRETVAEAEDGVELDRTARYLKEAVRVGHGFMTVADIQQAIIPSLSIPNFQRQIRQHHSSLT